MVCRCHVAPLRTPSVDAVEPASAAVGQGHSVAQIAGVADEEAAAGAAGAVAAVVAVLGVAVLEVVVLRADMLGAAAFAAGENAAAGERRVVEAEVEASGNVVAADAATALTLALSAPVPGWVVVIPAVHSGSGTQTVGSGHGDLTPDPLLVIKAGHGALACPSWWPGHVDLFRCLPGPNHPFERPVFPEAGGFRQIRHGSPRIRYAYPPVFRGSRPWISNPRTTERGCRTQGCGSRL